MIRDNSVYISSIIFSSCFSKPITSGFFPILSSFIPRFRRALLARLWRSAVLKQILPLGSPLKLARSKGIMTSATYVPLLCSLRDVLVINAGLTHISPLKKYISYYFINIFIDNLAKYLQYTQNTFHYFH